MEKYRTQRRYLVNGSSAIATEEKREVIKPHQPERKPLSRAIADVLPVQYVAVVAISAAIILASTITYIGAKTDINLLNNEVASLQTSLTAIGSENHDIQNQIATSTDINTVKKKAAKMGMKPAKENQIVYYESSDSEYVKQKDDIPNE